MDKADRLVGDAPKMAEPILRVAVPSPLHRYFDYLPPAGIAADSLVPGARVRVPFGKRRAVGVLAEIADRSELPAARLRRAQTILDAEPVIPPELLALARWAADYYRYPPGEVLAAVLPKTLRAGRPDRPATETGWRLTAAGRVAEPDKRASRQAALLRLLAEHSRAVPATTLAQYGEGWRAPLKRLIERGWIETVEMAAPVAAATTPETGPVLNADQAGAVAAITANLGSFNTVLLDGVTGSGKTEVYLAVVAAVLVAGRQALVLAPEIALGPQLLKRFERRLGVPVAAYHSGLADGERERVWRAARDGTAGVVIAMRSGIFLPLARPGLVICDEEHDPSYKQQDGFRYSARDLAVVRAQRLGVPVILGTATPSLESLYNVRRGRYRRLRLAERTNAAAHPPFRIVDVRGQHMQAGLSPRLLDATAAHLDAGGQVLLFLNRRGFAPVLRCHDCGATAECRRCDARMTVHRRRARLTCHHCGAERPLPVRCESCGGSALAPLGQGTERLEDVLAEYFPATRLVRIDRDSTRRKGEMQRLLDDMHSGRGGILVGTQMVAKGHDFPNLTLVGVIDADQGLYGVDFRAAERMAQLITQVAGRAGRADKPGEVMIQTHHPDHPLLHQLAGGDYARFAEAALAEREAAGLPPFTYMALIRAEAADAEAPQRFLETVRELAERQGRIPPRLRRRPPSAFGAKGARDGPADAASNSPPWPRSGEGGDGGGLFSTSGNGSIDILGPAPAPMLRRQGRYRFQLLLQACNRNVLQARLNALMPEIEALKQTRRVRWAIDVDPIELF